MEVVYGVAYLTAGNLDVPGEPSISLRSDLQHFVRFRPNFKRLVQFWHA